MKQFFKMFFASFLAIIIAGVVVVGIGIGLLVAAISNSVKPTPEKVSISSSSILRIDMRNAIHEIGEENSFAAFSGEEGYTASLYDVVKSINYAKEDDDIKGIYIRLGSSPNGWATLQEVRAAIVSFKESGKFVYAYGENITQGSYYVATAADSIFLNPVGDMELKGFATVLAFFKGSLDKLEVEPEIFYAGKFKSATEPFRTTKMSDANRQQIQEFQADFWNEFVTAVAGYTKKSKEEIAALATTGAIEFPKDAVANNLISNLLYADGVEARLKDAAGMDEDSKLKLLSINRYAKKVYQSRKIKDNKVAVLMAEGEIIKGEKNDMYQIASTDMIEQIRKVRENDDVKAVVLRVNSPGGSALASEMIWRELQLLKEKKPIIVSMGDYAASGGYYISALADSIFVMPNTITGSIGVFSMLFSTENLMKNKLGVTFDEVKTAPYADFPSGVRTLTAEERARMQRSVDNIYHIFKTRVADGRRMDINVVDEVAQGRVWTGTDAIEKGLADGYGGLARAIESASAVADLDDYQVVTYPEPVDRFEALFKNITKNNIKVDIAKAVTEYEITEEYQLIKRLKNLKRINGQNMAWLPYSIEVK